MFVCYFHYTGWENIQLGISIDVSIPNLEIHLPAGFVRIGWTMTRKAAEGYRKGPRCELRLLPAREVTAR